MFIERVAKYSSSLQRSETDLVPFPEALRVVAWTKLGPALVPDALTLLRLQDYWRRGNRNARRGAGVPFHLSRGIALRPGFAHQIRTPSRRIAFINAGTLMPSYLDFEMIVITDPS
jgi:hypothetical protein